MKIKRSQFTITIALVGLFAVTAALQLLSAYGAMCVAWVDAWRSPTSYVNDYLVLFRVSNIITWVFAFFWGFIIYCVFAQKKIAYILALATSLISCIFGLIPALIAEGVIPYSEYVAGTFEIGSPHWARTFANGLVFLLLLADGIWHLITKKGNLMTFTAPGNKIDVNVSKQLVMMSMFFFWLSLVSFLGTNFMRAAHVVDGINIWQLVEAQNIGGISTAVVGGSMLGVGMLLKQISASKSLISTMEGK